jgi:hypothetical protein
VDQARKEAQAMSRTYCHTTKRADEAESFDRIAIVNDSATMKVTMTLEEAEELAQRFFMPVTPIIEDGAMRKILRHFHESNQLQWELCSSN